MEAGGDTFVIHTGTKSAHGLAGPIALASGEAVSLQVYLQEDGPVDCATADPGDALIDQEVTPEPRYLGLVDLLQETSRRLVTFGLHVHVGLDSGDKAIMVCDRILEHLPTLLAMSVTEWPLHKALAASIIVGVGR